MTAADYAEQHVRDTERIAVLEAENARLAAENQRLRSLVPTPRSAAS